MKNVIQHPEPERDAQGGRVYWKSLGEQSESPEFQQWLQREFPAGASEFWGDGVSRRNFLQLMGASMALAGLGMTGCRRPEAHLVASSKTPEWHLPGEFVHYASSFTTRKGSEPLLVTTFNGRPVKVEGNPDHPASQGKTGTFAQASVLNLYDPDRAKSFLKDGKTTDEAAFVAASAEWQKEWLATGGAGWAVLSGDMISPTTQRLKEELLSLYPNMLWATYEPAYLGNDLKASAKLFGANTRQRPLIDKARVILSLDADFLSGQHGQVADIRGFAAGRDVEKPESEMNRLYVAESRYTSTGGMSDHRLRLPASHVGHLAAAIGSELGVSASPGNIPGVDPKWIRECARDLKKHAGRALVLVGDEQPVEVHELVAAINRSLGAYGATLEVIDWKQGCGIEISELAETIKAGATRGLIILNGNPVYDAPADLNWAELQKKVSTVVRFSSHLDETSKLSHWQIPAAHYLECWGDGVAADGTYCCQQPMILPLFGGWSESQLLLSLAGRKVTDGPEEVRKTFALVSGRNGDTEWKRFVRDGFLNKPVAARNTAPAGAVPAIRKAKPLSADNLELVFTPDPSVDDGTWANNGWMQEVPDPITKITWDNAAQISPATADELGLFYKTIKGVETTDVVEISLGGRSIEIAVIVVPGHPDHTLTLPLGYGREVVGKVGQDTGFNVYPLRVNGGCCFTTGATLKKVGRRYGFAITQEHWSMEGRGIVREAPIDMFRKDPNIMYELGMESHTPENRSFYKPPEFDYENFHQWGMTIDLSTCVGCNACTIACQAENNIPIVGKDQVKKGREMHWIRIDRYYTGASKFKTDGGKEAIPNEPEMVTQPVLCQHCENAPCETVCPVNATVHNEEGLNVMAYNRCIGTRYCANNCPYKVRRFNWFDYNQRQLDQLYFTGRLREQGVWGTVKDPLGPKGTEEMLKMSKNPNVTVRMRGVIEKCTFCVQRLEMAKIQHKSSGVRKDDAKVTAKDLKIPTDSVKVACQQACPADAIVFGDLSDPKSRVNKVRERQQGYQLLSYLNTRPRITYLGRLRNPNPAMPGADQVGMALINAKYHGPAASHGHNGDPGHGKQPHAAKSEGGHH